LEQQKESTIEKAIEYIERHLSDSLTVDKIAKIVGYSKFYLSRIFKDYVGCSIYHYIQQRRLTESARHLIYSNMSITDISLISGYDTQQAFTAAFKKVYQVSPRLYRAKNVFYPLLERHTRTTSLLFEANPIPFKKDMEMVA